MAETKASPLDRTVFGTSGRSFSVSDVIDWAFVRGDLDAHWKTVVAGVEAERLAGEQELEFEQEALNGAAETFRYAHDLITAEETERWLEERSVTLSDFASYFARGHWRAQLGDKVKPPSTDFLGASPELRDALGMDLTFSDELDKIAARMTWRVAASEGPNPADVDQNAVDTMRADFFKRANIDSGNASDRLGQIGRDTDWLDQQLRMEARYQAVADLLLTPQNRDRELTNVRLPLTRFDLETIELDSSDAAREAMFCVREDGMSMEEVAAEGRYPYRRAKILLEDIAPDLQQRFLNVRAGTLIDPIPRGDGLELCRVVEKAEPDPNDPAVKQRVDSRILNRHFGELTAKHITWSLLRLE